MARRTYSEQERGQIRIALMSTTLRCIVDRGLIHSSIDILCKEVGISKTFFYTFFPSKEELVLEALRYQQPRLLEYARQLMEDPSLGWREGVRTFLESCVYGDKKGIAILSIEEEQEVYRCLSQENFQIFREDQTNLFSNLLGIFGLPADSLDPRLFGNLLPIPQYGGIQFRVAEAMTVLPFLFPEAAEDMVNFQINALLDELQRAKANGNRVNDDAQK